MRVRRLRSAPAIPLAALTAILAAACSADRLAPSIAEPAQPAESVQRAGLTPATARPSFALINAGGLYWNDFDFLSPANMGMPGGPPFPEHPITRYNPTDFDVVMHSRDQSTWYAPEPFRGMHGTACLPYQTPEPENAIRPGDVGSHAIGAYEDMNYRCRNHMMTALNATGYGAIYLTPNAMVDFADGEASIKWAMSTLRTSARDWIDIWVTPWSDNLELPNDGSLSVSTDLQGVPRTGLHIRMLAEQTRSRFEAYVINNFTEGKLPVVSTNGYETILTPVSQRRDTFELRISPTRVRFGVKKIATAGGPAGSLTWIDASVRLSFTRGVVQFGHHSMNPAYGGGSPDTWHWDDVTISPAVPFTIIRTALPNGDRVRYVDAATAATPVPFERAAPDGAYLRFAAFGASIEVSVDGGATWSAARVQPATFNKPDRFRSYWTPIPAGTTSVLFRAGGDAPGVWMVRDMSIWSLAN